ncbi:hypothetical protein J2W35_002282 [Variovorax boronicumulans]|nr:hypothetical protein [Variovorax boronicumulans]
MHCGQHRHQPAGRHVGRRQDRRQRGNAQPCTRSLEQHALHVADEAPPHPHVFFHTVGALQAPGREIAAVRWLRHAVVLEQLLQAAGCAPRRQVGGTGKKASVACEDLAGHEARVLQGPAAKGDVDAIADEVGHDIVENEVQPHPWMRGQEIGNPFHLEKIEKTGRRGHAYQAARFLAALDLQPPGAYQRFDRRAASFLERLAGIGQRQFAGGALQQPGAQVRLELPDAPAHRR